MSNQLITRENNERVKGFFSFTGTLICRSREIICFPQTNLERGQFLHGRRTIREIETKPEKLAGLPKRGTNPLYQAGRQNTLSQFGY